jgi:cell wall-associated NlpC family hydrolase
VGRPTVFTVTALSSSGSSSASSAPFTLSPIDGYYATLGGPSGYLRAPTSTEGAAGAGRVRTFVGGAIYWSSATGPHAVHGLILQKYLQYGGPTAFVGFPTSDESAAGTGRRSTFTGADIYWSGPTGTHELRGTIRATYASVANAPAFLGLPTTDETTTPDGTGRYNHFSADASIYWTPATGAHEVHGAIRDRWAAGGWELGILGYPISNVYSVSGARRSDFQFGSISWTPSGGALQTVTRGDRIVAVARTHLGQRYVYGAAGPTTFDCSGLVQYVHRQLGMSIPRTTWLQAPASRPIAKSAAMPGDIIFLLDGSHEGIYVGGGQMIDAPHTGDVVRQRAIWTSSYSVGRFW